MGLIRDSTWAQEVALGTIVLISATAIAKPSWLSNWQGRCVVLLGALSTTVLVQRALQWAIVKQAPPPLERAESLPEKKGLFVSDIADFLHYQSIESSEPHR